MACSSQMPIVEEKMDIKGISKRPVTRSITKTAAKAAGEDESSSSSQDSDFSSDYDSDECKEIDEPSDCSDSESSPPQNKKARENGEEEFGGSGNKSSSPYGKSYNLNFSKHSQLIPWFSAATILHFQNVLEHYIVGDGWLYVDFVKVAKSAGLDKVFHCMVTPIGEYSAQVAHYELALASILDAAKIQLFAPWKKYMTFGVTTCIKRQVGGIFLIYYIFKEMPRPPDSKVVRQPKLMMDYVDVIALRMFMRDISKLPNDGNGLTIKNQVLHVYLQLRKDESLEFNLNPILSSSENHHAKRENLSKRGELIHFGALKDLRDQLLYFKTHGIGKHFLTQLATHMHPDNPSLDEPLLTPPKDRQRPSGFPPKKWAYPTPKLVFNLRKERNLAVISARISEIMKFITPPNPYTPERLHTAKEHYSLRVFNDLKKSLGPHQSTWTQRPKRKQPLSARNYRISNNNRRWIEYIKGECTSSPYVGLADEQILQKLEKGVDVDKVINMIEPNGDQVYHEEESDESSWSDEPGDEEVDPTSQMPMDMPTL